MRTVITRLYYCIAIDIRDRYERVFHLDVKSFRPSESNLYMLSLTKERTSEIRADEGLLGKPFYVERRVTSILLVAQISRS